MSSITTPTPSPSKSSLTPDEWNRLVRELDEAVSGGAQLVADLEKGRWGRQSRIKAVSGSIFLDPSRSAESIHQTACAGKLAIAIKADFATDGVIDKIRAILDAEKTYGHLVDAERAAEEQRLAEVRALEAERLRLEKEEKDAEAAAAAAIKQEQVAAAAAFLMEYDAFMEEEEEVDELVTEETDPETGGQEESSEDPRRGSRVQGTPPPKRETRSSSGRSTARRGKPSGTSVSPGSMRVEVPARETGRKGKAPLTIPSRGGRPITLDSGAEEQIPPCPNCADRELKCYVVGARTACEFCRQARMRCAGGKRALATLQTED
jgi:hypothetical protein